MSGVNVRTANQPPRLPLLGYDENHDAFANHAYVVARVSYVGNTNAEGYITVTHKPIISQRRPMDNNDNLDVAKDIVAKDGSGNTLYVGTVNAKAGVLRLYTDAGLNNVAANKVGCVVEYWYPAPMDGVVQDDGTFKPRVDVALAGSTLSDEQAIPTKLTGSIETVNDNPVTGIKTVTATAAELFAGGSVKASRRKLIVKNEDQTLRLRIGKSDVTQQNGYPIEPGATVEFQFDPNVAVPIYAISEGANMEVAVMEI